MQAEAAAEAEVEAEVQVEVGRAAMPGPPTGSMPSYQNDLLLSAALAAREDNRLKSIMISCQTSAQLEDESLPAECDSNTFSDVTESQAVNVLSSFDQDLAMLSVIDMPLTAPLTHSSSCMELLERKDATGACDFKDNPSPLCEKRKQGEDKAAEKLVNAAKDGDVSPLERPSCPQLFKRECTFDVSTPKAAGECPNDTTASAQKATPRQVSLEVERIVQDIGSLFVQLQLKQQQLSSMAKAAPRPKQQAAAGPDATYVVTLQTAQGTPRCVVHPLDGLPSNIQKLLLSRAKAATAKMPNMPSGTPVSRSNHSVRVPSITILAPNEVNANQAAGGRFTSRANLAPVSLNGRQLQDAGVTSPLSTPGQKARSKSFLQPPKNYLCRKPQSK